VSGPSADTIEVSVVMPFLNDADTLAVCIQFRKHNGYFDRYWEFHIEQDQRRLYPAWTVVPK
jgi:hypothetical protein